MDPEGRLEVLELLPESGVPFAVLALTSPFLTAKLATKTLIAPRCCPTPEVPSSCEVVHLKPQTAPLSNSVHCFAAPAAEALSLGFKVLSVKVRLEEGCPLVILKSKDVFKNRKNH